ncbi:hypothetical protein PS2_034748 [Malus domestica]
MPENLYGTFELETSVTELSDFRFSYPVFMVPIFMLYMQAEQPDDEDDLASPSQSPLAKWSSDGVYVVPLGPLAVSQVVLEGFDGLVDELVVGGRVPLEPLASVAVKVVAIEHWRLMGGRGAGGILRTFLGSLFFGVLGGGD